MRGVLLVFLVVVHTIISGGQTGADRGGLEAAQALGLQTGGWAPADFMTEGGPDPTLAAFGLQVSGSYEWRTERNVLDGDATIIFGTQPSPGSDLTAECAERHGTPFLRLDPWAPDAVARVRDFIAWVRPGILNVAGHRESVAPGIQARIRAVLLQALQRI